MTWRPPEPADPADWRRRAEAQMEGEEPEAPEGLETARVVHELRVHQLELEMQNEALRESQLTAEAGWQRFQELYDSAPAAFFSVDAQGTILELNLAGARLLGGEPGDLAFRRFDQFLRGTDQAAFAGFVRRGLERRENPPCEVLLVGSGPPARVRLHAAMSADGKVLQLAAMDISQWGEDRAERLEEPLARLEECGRRLAGDLDAEPDRLVQLAREIETASRRIRELL
jgi:PAS domain S-box-containing protein